MTGDGGSGASEDRPSRLLVNVADLRRRLGQRSGQAITVELARRTVVATHTRDRPIVGSVTVESIERGVSVLGEVRFAWAGECRRCLELVEGELDVEIDEIFQVGAPDDSDIIDFDGDQIDLLPVVRDAVALSLPLAPLCEDDCEGPDPDRYRPQMAADADETADRIDPRWAALDELRETGG